MKPRRPGRRPMTLVLSALLLLIVSLVSGAAPSSAHSGDGDDHHRGHHQVRLHGQVPTVGFFRGEKVTYLDEGPVQLAKDASGAFISDVDPIWAVTNGVAAQRNIIDNVPGLNHPDDYTPLWQVVQVTWNAGTHPRLLTSARAVQRAADRGQVTLVTTDTVVNCPVLGFHQPVTRGFFRGHGVSYLDEGPIALATDSGGAFISDVDPIWAVTNGVAAQRNIIDNVPGLNHPDDYTPLWQVVQVTWRPGVSPRLLTSATAVQAAVAAGLVDLVTTDTVVNCPVL